MAKDPAAVAAKWAANLGQAGSSIQAGVQGVTVSPTAKAAQAVDRQVAGVQRAAATGKTQQALQAVSLQAWQQSMIQKGLPRIATGASAAKPKFQSFMTSLMQYQQSGLANLPPRGDTNQNIQRMVAWAQYMTGFKKPAGT